jgi:hypothetical protein
MISLLPMYITVSLQYNSLQLSIMSQFNLIHDLTSCFFNMGFCPTLLVFKERKEAYEITLLSVYVYACVCIYIFFRPSVRISTQIFRLMASPFYLSVCVSLLNLLEGVRDHIVVRASLSPVSFIFYAIHVVLNDSRRLALDIISCYIIVLLVSKSCRDSFILGFMTE